MKWNSQVMKKESHSKSPKQNIKTEQDQVMTSILYEKKDYVCFLKCSGGGGGGGEGGGQCFSP